MSYVSCYFHCVWSTKDRRTLITPELEERLWPYSGGIAREHKMKAIAIGGIEDHIHILLSIHQTMAVSKAIQLIKGGSSKWVHDEFPEHRDFQWQEGYGAFSIGVSQIDDTVGYIGRQKEHHAKWDYKAEFLEFLKRNHVEYDPRYVFA
jgi:REP-associated tyrosine transposase